MWPSRWSRAIRTRFRMNAGAWFAGYVSDAYRQTNQDLIDRIDALGVSVDEATAQHLCEIFENCCRFDLRFWDMVYTMGRQCAPLCSGEA